LKGINRKEKEKKEEKQKKKENKLLTLPPSFFPYQLHYNHREPPSTLVF
jgi:hypothetical protein